jgi:cyclopropane-fatty-acyl-phospholipid synthase
MLAYLPPHLHELQLPLRLRLWDGKQLDLGPNPRLTMVVKDPSLVTQLAHPSLDVLGGAYVEGRLDLEGPIETVIELGDALSRALPDDAVSAEPLRARHDKAGDAQAISYHYDLSNDFYGLWLDRELIYSCAYYENGDEDLDQAQQAELRRLWR